MSVRLYVFDNGVIKGIDPARFEFKKEDLATTEMVVASYLIVHPKGTLLVGHRRDSRQRA